MTATGWRNLAVLLGVLSMILLWRDCTRPSAKVHTVVKGKERADRDDGRGGEWSNDGRSGRTRGRAGAAAEPTDEELAAEDDTGENDPAWSVTAPAWVLWLAPQPGEHLLDYRDRIVPLAQAAVAPHRARVARGREDFAAVAGLTNGQRAELDAAVAEAATAIQDRVLNAALGGELMPSTFKPTTGVAVARDILDAVDKANQRFQGSLREDQRTALASHPFDVADYLLFSTRWEDMLGAR